MISEPWAVINFFTGLNKTNRMKPPLGGREVEDGGGPDEDRAGHT